MEMDRNDMFAVKGGITQEQRDAEQKIIDQKFGVEPTECAKVFAGEDLVAFDKYVDFQEALNYSLMLHCMRMVLLIKLVNKST